MFSITQGAAPGDSLLKTYQGGVHPERWGRYGDCFSVEVARAVSLAEFVFAFYTSPVFRIERWLLRAFIGAPSSDAGARGLADGSAASFAAWYVGDRNATQLLMCDRFERTRSWFRVVALDGGGTLLQFGSAVAAAPGSEPGGGPVGGPVGEPGAAAQSRGFRLLLGFHVLYSQVLLNAAKVSLNKARPAG
jgi:hypothetical protein